MKKYHGTLLLESNYKALTQYIIVIANSLEEAKKLACEKYNTTRLKPKKILEVNLSELVII